MLQAAILLSVLSFSCAVPWQQHQSAGPYQPTWPSIDSRPLPAWYDDVKVGIFVHFGVFSVPAFGPASSPEAAFLWYYWQGPSPNKDVIDYMAKYRPGFTYADFAANFKAELFNATYWASLFKNSGAKYVVLTTKHHEGFTLWPSNNSWNWNAMQVGPKRDIVGKAKMHLHVADTQKVTQESFLRLSRTPAFIWVSITHFTNGLTLCTWR